ncbi:MAG: CHAT domain-containing protein [Cyanothece sp. SIO2G6]|nr:CHAT domain-containing protein [Cyanothece sp. SIO2G6]
MLRGKALQEALAWATDKNLSKEDYQFLTASQEFDLREAQKAVELERQAVEAERIQKALEAEQEANRILTKAQERAEIALEEERATNQRIRRRTRIGGVVLACSLLLAIATAGWAEQAARRSQRQVQTANDETQKLQQEAEELRSESQILEAQQKQTEQDLETTVDLLQISQDRILETESAVESANQDLLDARAMAASAENRAQAASQQEALAFQRVEETYVQLAEAEIGLEEANRRLKSIADLEEVAEEFYRLSDRLKDTTYFSETASLLSAEGDFILSQAASSLAIENSDIRQAFVFSSLASAKLKLFKRYSDILGIPIPNRTESSEQFWNTLTLFPDEIFSILSPKIEGASVGNILAEANQTVADGLRLINQSLDDNPNPSLDELAIEAYLLNLKGEITHIYENQQGAFSAYLESFDILESMHSSLDEVQPILKRSLSENIAAYYHRLADLLLEKYQISSDYDDLYKARQVIESYNLSRLSQSLQIVSKEDVKQIEHIDPNSVAIYPIVGKSNFHTIIDLPGQPLEYHFTPLTSKEVNEAVLRGRQLMRARLSSRAESHLKDVLQEMHNSVLGSVETKLEQGNTETLAFVVDGVLANYPLACLYNGQNFLVEKYSVASVPSLQLIKDQKKELTTSPSILLAGVSESVDNFPAIPNVLVELYRIRSLYNNSALLLDKDFTIRKFRQAISTQQHSIVHIATHSNFGAFTSDNFILSWNRRFTHEDLSNFVSSEIRSDNPIDLFVLSTSFSAHSSIWGDNRFPYGLAGQLFRSGVRTNIGILWGIPDVSTAQLMQKFHQELFVPGTTRAEALRQAQLSLLNTPEFSLPYYWAGIVLVGDWR